MRAQFIWTAQRTKLEAVLEREMDAMLAAAGLREGLILHQSLLRQSCVTGPAAHSSVCVERICILYTHMYI